MSVEAMLRAHERLHAARAWLRTVWDIDAGAYLVEIHVRDGAGVEDGWHLVGGAWDTQAEAIGYALHLIDWREERTDLTLPDAARTRAVWAAAPDAPADAIAAAGERGRR